MIVLTSLRLLYPSFPGRQHTLVVGIWAGIATIAAGVRLLPEVRQAAGTRLPDATWSGTHGRRELVDLRGRVDAESAQDLELRRASSTDTKRGPHGTSTSFTPPLPPTCAWHALTPPTTS